MTQPLDPNSAVSRSGGQAKPSVEAYYQQAVAALKAKQYDQALAQFQQLGKLPPHSPYQIKALMGQVQVHQRVGQLDRVKALCQQLLNSPSPQANQWARQVLGQLSQPEAIASPAAPRSVAPPIVPGPVTPDPGSSDLSGFTPLSGDPITAAPAPPTPSAPPPPSQPEQAEATAPQPPEGLASLFHYQQLNQQPPSGAEAQPPPPLPSSPASESPNDHRSAKPAAIAAPRRPTQTSPSRPPRGRPAAPLPARPLKLWVSQGLTAIAILWAINWAVHFVLRTLDQGLRWIRWPVRLSLPGAQQSYTVWIVGGLILLALASPWLLDYALAFWYRQKPLSPRQLQNQHNEALRLLRQVCRQQGWQLPELRLIAHGAPLCFSYGWLPRNTRIVVSQGLLEQCSEETLKTLYGYELARMVNGSLPVLSGAGLLLLLLHTAYYRLAQVGDRLSQPLAQIAMGLLAGVFYGLFWLLRQGLLWLSRRCGWWGDRRTIALTQRPDQLAEGLLDLTRAIATYLQRHGSPHPLHSSLEVLMPVSSRQAISPGSLLISPADAPLSTAAWMVADGLNPYRQWLQANSSHLPLGERLLWINQEAQMRGQPAVELATPSTPTVARVSPALLFLQKGPLAGVLIGGGVAMVLWFVGGIVNRLGWQRLSWLYQDDSILWGGLWLGLGLGLLLRINTLFPESPPTTKGNGSTPATAATATTVASLMQSTAPLPVKGQPVTLRGHLKGLPGLGNWGSQDLYLEDASGVVRLTNPDPWSSLKGLGPGKTHPRHWLGRQVTVTGWGRYGGGLLWVDINQVQLDARQRFQAYGPLWATGLSLASCLIGIAIIFRGG